MFKISANILFDDGAGRLVLENVDFSKLFEELVVLKRMWSADDNTLTTERLIKGLLEKFNVQPKKEERK